MTIQAIGGRGGRAPVVGTDSVTVPDATGATRTIDIIPDVSDSGTSRGKISRTTSLPQPNSKTIKLSLNIKVDKNGKLSGYFVTGTIRQKAHDWHTDSNKLTFTTLGPKGAPRYNYTAVLNGEELQVHQTPADRGPDVYEFSLKR